MAKLYSGHAQVQSSVDLAPVRHLTGDRLLRNQGWVQITEWDLTFRSDTADMDDLQALHEWTRVYIEALGRTNRAEGRKSARVTQDCETWLRMAGFVNVSSDIRDIPTCAWRMGMST